MKKEPVEEIIVPSEEREKILNDSTVPKFVTKKMDWNKWLSSSQYPANKNIRFKIRFMWYSGAYIVVKGTITVEVDDDEKKRNKKLRWCCAWELFGSQIPVTKEGLNCESLVCAVVISGLGNY